MYIYIYIKWKQFCVCCHFNIMCVQIFNLTANAHHHSQLLLALSLTHSLSLYFSIHWCFARVWILLHLRLAFHSYRQWTRHMYWLLFISSSVCMCCVCVYSKHRIYSIFWPSFIDFSFVVRQTYAPTHPLTQTHISKRYWKMLQAISYTTLCVYKFVA